jgi:hypothetical protein
MPAAAEAGENLIMPQRIGRKQMEANIDYLNASRAARRREEIMNGQPQRPLLPHWCFIHMTRSRRLCAANAKSMGLDCNGDSYIAPKTPDDIVADWRNDASSY